MLYLKLVLSVCLLQEVKEERSSFICPLCNKNCMTQHQLTMHIRQVRTLTQTHPYMYTCLLNHSNWFNMLVCFQIIRSEFHWNWRYFILISLYITYVRKLYLSVMTSVPRLSSSITQIVGELTTPAVSVGRLWARPVLWTATCWFTVERGHTSVQYVTRHSPPMETCTGK